MRHIVLGTAGHVDHGKTALIRALTGIDCDRLEEERRRGLTIELGYAEWRLPSGVVADVVDVPGHERFIRAMLLGAGGLDAVLLTIAADDGIMPQTREHLAILDFLGVRYGVIAITKCDLAEREQIESLSKEIRRMLQGTSAEQFDIVCVSSHTGHGLAELTEAVDKLARTVPAHKTDRPFCMPIDRAFTVAGSGTVVTGTVIDGSVRTGDHVYLYPNGDKVRVRELQSHGSAVTDAQGGMRLAVNLPNVSKDAFSRGCFLSGRNDLQPTDRLLVSLKSCGTIRNGDRLTLYLGTQERNVHVRLPDCDCCCGKDAHFAVLRSDKPFYGSEFDRFILRRPSPPETVGGGVVLEVNCPRYKRFDSETINVLSAFNSSARDRVIAFLFRSGMRGVNRERLYAFASRDPNESHAVCDRLESEGSILRLNQTTYVLTSAFRETETKLLHALREHETRDPSGDGMPASRLANELSLNEAILSAMLKILLSEGKIHLDRSTVTTAGFQPMITPVERAVREQIIGICKSNGFFPTELQVLREQINTEEAELDRIVRSMLRSGELVHITNNVFLLGETIDRIQDRLVDFCTKNGGVTLAEFRTELGISRKPAQLILEYFDRTHRTSFDGTKHYYHLKGR